MSNPPTVIVPESHARRIADNPDLIRFVETATGMIAYYLNDWREYSRQK